MLKQNRVLGNLFIFAVIILGFILYRAGKLIYNDTQNASPTNKQTVMGDLIPESNNEGDQAAKEEKQKTSQELLQLLIQCFGISAKAPEQNPNLLESILTVAQPNFGVPTITDHSMAWYIHNRDGLERRLFLTVTENAEGVLGRELHYFAIDKFGALVPLMPENIQVQNPSDEEITHILNEGEVFYKEKSGICQFPNDAQLEYVNKNGELAELTFTYGKKIFKCASLKSCLCE